MSFYIEYTPINPNIDDFIVDKDQFRDGKRRYTNPKTHDKMIVPLFRGDTIFYKRAQFEKNEDGKYIVDCDIYSTNYKETLNNNEALKCKICGVPNMMHGRNHEFEYRQRETEYRKVRFPSWLPKDEIVFTNKRPDDVICD